LKAAAQAQREGGMRVLVIEDESSLRETLKTQLTEAGFTVDVAQDGVEGLFAGLEYPLDVAVIDLGLPKLTGLEVIGRLRAARKTYPILILTARDSWQDKVEGLQAGADDYVAKPFHFEEVLARLQALLRRAGGWASPQLKCGPVILDTRAQSVKVGDQPVELTTFEYRILEHLMLRAGEVISKAELTERLYDQDFERDSNVIEVLVGRLRRKLDPEERLRPIETLRGRGYRFSLSRESAR
jgi:two-component system response regulator PhoP